MSSIPQPNRMVSLSHSLVAAIRLLKLSADVRSLKHGKSIHAQLITSQKVKGVQDCLVLSNSLINLYAKCSQLAVARRLFDGMPERNVVSWSALMAGYFQGGFWLEVIRLFKTMVFSESMPPHEYVFATVLSACSDGQRIHEGLQCHGHVMKSGLVAHQYVKNALINMYSRCSCMEGALQLLNIMPGPDVYSYNLTLSGLLDRGLLGEALQIVHMMVGAQLVWDSVSYVSAFGLCSHLKALKLGSQVHGQLITTNGACDNIIVGSAIIDMYGRCGQLSNAKKIFDGLKTQNVVSWTSILAAHFQNGCFEEALKLFLQKELKDVLHNEYSFSVVLNSCAGLSALTVGSLLHSSLWKRGFMDHVIVGNALVNMYSKCGDIEAAGRVFSGMICRDSVTWNAMISGFSHHGLGKESLGVFHDMLEVKEPPDYVTFVGVLSACSHLGRVREGLYYLDHLMKGMGVEPGLEHHTCIVCLLSRAGRLDDALNFMRHRPVKWDAVAWRSLLGACYLNRNYGLGRQVADMVLRVDPEDVGTYILLCNMYAKANRWGEAVKVRELMSERNIKKEPGVSWIEIRNTTHVFASGGNEHPDLIEILEMVQVLLAKIGSLGYAPDVASVVHDVEEEQKEASLVYHSEKLAIAYGIMKMPLNTPLRVIKNLRMCEDCHSAAKYISKIASRVIIVRDANRFHSFRDGFCSCADYW